MTTRLSGPHRRAIVLLSVAAAASGASARMCDPMLPELVRAFSTSPAATAHVVSGFMLAYGLVQACFGPLGDRVGKVRLIALTCLASTVGSLAAAFAGGLDQLVTARVLTGIAAAGVIPLAMAWIGDTVAYEQRQTTLARFLTGQILGVIGGQFIGGVFTETVGWRWAFGFVCLIFLAVGVALLAESGRNPIARHRPVGTTGPGGIVTQVAAVLSVGWARVILAIVFLEGAAVFGPLAFVPTYLHQRFAIDLTTAGALMGLFGVGGLSYIAFTGFFVRRFGEAGLALLGGLLIATAWTVLALGDIWQCAFPVCAMVGLGYYMLHNTLQTNATQMAPQMRGTAVSLFASAFFLGQSVGVSLTAVALTAAGPRATYLTAAVAVPMIGAVFSALLRRRGRSP